MTRINADIDPSLLERRHLVAELREIAMVPASLKRSRRTLTPESILPRIPKEFTLNSGHVLFFYDKIEFLRRRLKGFVRRWRTETIILIGLGRLYSMVSMNVGITIGKLPIKTIR